MTERYPKLARKHIAKTGSVSREVRNRLEPRPQTEGEQEILKKEGHIARPRSVRIASENQSERFVVITK